MKDELTDQLLQLSSVRWKKHVRRRFKKKKFERSSSFKIETLPLLPSRSLRVEAERLSSLRATVNSSCDKIFWIIFCLRNEFRVIGSSKENLSSGSGLIYAENLQRRESTFVNFHM